ncbi:MAG: DUF692 domain-containing protein [Deltaproteobacteria bacterium]|nr:DUF692 domain-containing protein [Deltaproteobacteria bacterium]
MNAHLGGVGLGFRRELAHALLSDPRAVDFVEVVAETCRDRAALREAMALRELWPVVPHGVKLSLGSAEGLDLGRARELGRIAKALKAPLVSEHVSFVRAGGREIGHLTELPMTREAVSVVARNVAALRRELPDIPLLLENVARAFVWPESAHEMTEGEFHAEIAEATGCDLLLDVGNLYANAVNAGRDPSAELASFPLDRVAMLHVAGGVEEHGFYFDTHAHPIPAPVLDLVARVPGVPVLLERDAGFDSPADPPRSGRVDASASILAEVALLRASRAPGGAVCRARTEHATPPPDRVVAELERRQTELALALTSSDATDDPAILRARGVLERKRADDALPLLPELGGRLAQHDALRLGRIPVVPRLPSMTAVADAMRIADAARGVPELARAAVRDGAILRARFSGGPDGPRPRALPCVVREEAADGRSVWAWKGFGAGAPVRVYERGARG